jgi:hypothetical protein
MSVVRLELREPERPLLDGRPFGEVGAYTEQSGEAEFAVDPNHPHNQVITDLAVANIIITFSYPPQETFLQAYQSDLAGSPTMMGFRTRAGQTWWRPPIARRTQRARSNCTRISMTMYSTSALPYAGSNNPVW